MTADLHLAAAAETLARLDEIGPDAYGANAPALIAEAQLRVAYAEAVTNRLLLLKSYDDIEDDALALALGTEEVALLESITDMDTAQNITEQEGTP